MTKLVLWSASRAGYSVRVIAGSRILDEYVTGNCRQDSQVWLDPNDPGALTEAELCACARRSAQELATEHSAQVVEEECE